MKLNIFQYTILLFLLYFLIILLYLFFILILLYSFFFSLFLYDILFTYHNMYLKRLKAIKLICLYFTWNHCYNNNNISIYKLRFNNLWFLLNLIIIIIIEIKSINHQRYIYIYIERERSMLQINIYYNLFTFFFCFYLIKRTIFEIKINNNLCLK